MKTASQLRAFTTLAGITATSPVVLVDERGAEYELVGASARGGGSGLTIRIQSLPPPPPLGPTTLVVEEKGGVS